MVKWDRESSKDVILRKGPSTVTLVQPCKRTLEPGAVAHTYKTSGSRG